MIAIPVVGVLWYIGLATFVYYAHQPIADRPGTGDAALFRIISTQLPAPMPELIISAMLAAIMSTLDSGINGLATVITKEIYLRFLRPEATEVAQVRFSRWMTLATGLIAISMGLLMFALATVLYQSVMEVGLLWGALTYVLPGIFLIGVLSRRAGAVTALIAGAVGMTAVVAMLLWHIGLHRTASGRRDRRDPSALRLVASVVSKGAT